MSGWVNIPVSDNFALRVVGFWAEEGGYVDNVLGADLMNSETNADVAEDDQNIYRTTGGRVSGLWTINEDWNLLTTGIYQRGDTMGTWETDPLLGDQQGHALLRRVARRRRGTRLPRRSRATSALPSCR